MCRESPAQLGECALSVVTRRGGPSGSPAARHRPDRRARLRRSRPSWCRPATTPGRSRRASRSRASAPARTTCRRALAVRPAIVSTWLVPSRNRARERRDPASAMRLPSGDQVGVPGCGERVVDLGDRAGGDDRAPTSAATRHMPSTLKKTMRLPSGDQLAPCGCVVERVTWRLCPLFMSRIQSWRCALSLSDE